MKKLIAIRNHGLEVSICDNSYKNIVTEVNKFLNSPMINSIKIKVPFRLANLKKGLTNRFESEIVEVI